MEFDFEELVERAVKHPPKKSGMPMWARVRNVFGVGSTSGAELCRYFGIDPDYTEYYCISCEKWYTGSGDFCSEACKKADDSIEKPW